MRSTSPESIFLAKGAVYVPQIMKIMIFEILEFFWSDHPTLTLPELFPEITPRLLALHVANYDPKEGCDGGIVDIYG